MLILEVNVAQDTSNPEHFIEYRLVRVAERLRQRFERALRPYGLTPHRYSALAVLASAPDITAADLARAILVSPQAVGNLLDQLDRDGLITREGRRGRGRSTSITLTADGARLLEEATNEVRRLDAATTDALGAQNVRRLRQLLATIDASLADGRTESPRARSRL